MEAQKSSRCSTDHCHSAAWESKCSPFSRSSHCIYRTRLDWRFISSDGSQRSIPSLTGVDIGSYLPHVKCLTFKITHIMAYFTGERISACPGLTPTLPDANGSDNPAIEEDGQTCPEQARQVSGQHIGEPVFSLQYARIADGENNQHRDNLEWNQCPAIAPLADGFREAEVKEKAIKGNIPGCMTRGETLEWHMRRNVNMFAEGTRTGPGHQIVIEEINTSGKRHT